MMMMMMMVMSENCALLDGLGNYEYTRNCHAKVLLVTE